MSSLEATPRHGDRGTAAEGWHEPFLEEPRQQLVLPLFSDCYLSSLRNYRIS